MMAEPITVLFLESQDKLHSDSQVHALLMRSFDHQRVEVHVACNPGFAGSKSDSLAAFEAMPGVRATPICFGPPTGGHTKWKLAAHMVSVVRDFARLARYIGQHDVGVIHVASRPRDAFYGVILGKVTRTPTLIHLHLMYADWFSPVMRWALRNCDAILCISDFVRQSVLSADHNCAKTYRVLNGIDLEQWDPASDPSRVRGEFGIDQDTPLLAVVSRLFSWKGHTELLQALALVHAQEPSFKLLIVGEDDPAAHPSGGSYSNELKTLGRDLNLSENIIFAGFRTDVQSILAACDIYTMPSYEEPLGVAFLEAMAMQKPVIALASGGVPEIVEDTKSGLLSSPRDIEGLAANILTLIRDPQQRHAMGVYGRAHVKRFLDPRQLASETEQVYRRIVRDSS